MIARLEPPTECYGSQHGVSLCLRSGLKGKKRLENPHALLHALIFHSIRINYKSSNKNENTHGNNILMCLRNNTEDELNHLKKNWETIQGSKWKSGILIT